MFVNRDIERSEFATLDLKCVPSTLSVLCLISNRRVKQRENFVIILIEATILFDLDCDFNQHCNDDFSIVDYSI